MGSRVFPLAASVDFSVACVRLKPRLRPHRLARPRTPPSHGGDSGSNPDGVIMNIGEYYQLIRQCACGSGLLSSWCKDEKGVDVKACDRCKPKLLHKIFDEKYMDLFEEWLGSLFSEQAAKGYEWVWEDLLKEKGCLQVVGLEAAKQKQSEDQILIACPNGKDIYPRRRENPYFF